MKKANSVIFHSWSSAINFNLVTIEPNIVRERNANKDRFLGYTQLQENDLTDTFYLTFSECFNLAVR